METTTLSLPSKYAEIAKKLDGSVMKILSPTTQDGFDKAYLIALAMQELSVNLTDEFMKPIMYMQGKKLGFKTDKDKSGGYPQEIVKACLIDAVLMGLQPYNNQFNIIGGTCYPTKEGLGALLNKIPGLKKEIIPSIPVINADKNTAEVTMKIQWKIGGEENERDITFPIKIDAYSTGDSIIGKATRKARKWLYENITEIEVADGEVEDTEATVLSSKPNSGKPQHKNLSDILTNPEA